MTKTKKKMTRQEAVTKLVETRKLSTGMLEPLGLSFESFLGFAQATKKVREEVMDRLVEHYTSDTSE